MDEATAYNVNISTDGRSSWTRASSNVAGTTLTISSVDTGATVHVAVQAVNSAGVSGWANADPVDPYQTPPTQPAPTPSKPSWVSASWEGDTLVVTWAAAANASSYNVKANDIQTLDPGRNQRDRDQPRGNRPGQQWRRVPGGAIRQLQRIYEPLDALRSHPTTGYIVKATGKTVADEHGTTGERRLA